MVVLGVYGYGASFVLKFLRERKEGVHLDPRCAQKGVKSSLGTLVLKF